MRQEVLKNSVIVHCAMTEAHTGIPEIKQPKGNVIDFEASRQRLGEARQDQKLLPFMPPRTDRERREVARRRLAIREALIHEQGQRGEAQETPLNLRAVQKRVDGKWLSDFLEQRYSHPSQLVTEKEWARLARIDPTLHVSIKENMRLENRIWEIRQQAGGDQKVFDELWSDELKAIHAEADKQKVEEWAKVGIKRLPDEEWSKQFREMPDKKTRKLMKWISQIIRNVSLRLGS